MRDKNEFDDVKTRFTLPPQANLSYHQLNDYKRLHGQLPQVKKNTFTIYGAELKIINKKTIVVTAFVRNTIEQSLDLHPADLVLLDRNSQPFAKRKVDFTGLGALPPNTARPWRIEFPKESWLQEDMENLSRPWSLAFEKNLIHRVDYSGLDDTLLTEEIKQELDKFSEEAPLEDNAFSLLGLFAKLDAEENLVITLLLRNSTNRDLRVRQLPLKFYDAQGDLSAQGVFQFDELTIYPNTSKPVTLIFPESSILKNEMDLSKWSIVLNS